MRSAGATVLRRRAENKVSFLQSIQAAVYEHETKNEIQKFERKKGRTNHESRDEDETHVDETHVDETHVDET
jgi:hypothetical protein